MPKQNQASDGSFRPEDIGDEAMAGEQDIARIYGKLDELSRDVNSLLRDNAAREARCNAHLKRMDEVEKMLQGVNGRVSTVETAVSSRLNSKVVIIELTKAVITGAIVAAGILMGT